MIASLHKFTVLPWKHKLLFGQAWLMLGWYRAALVFISFRRLTAALAHHSTPTQNLAVPIAQAEQAAAIGKLVAQAANVTLWKSGCLVQVLVLRRLLARRRISGQLCLGVCRGEAQVEGRPGLHAHAWLQCGELIVNGAAGHEQFTVISTFSWDSGSRPIQGEG